jgi:hypothetical protein
MGTSDETPRPDPDGTVPDTAMASGSDAGEPGEHLGPADLRPDERRLLADLARTAAEPSPDAPEDDDALVRAAEDEGPLPAHGGAQDVGLTAIFTPPRED